MFEKIRNKILLKSIKVELEKAYKETPKKIEILAKDEELLIKITFVSGAKHLKESINSSGMFATKLKNALEGVESCMASLDFNTYDVSIKGTNKDGTKIKF